VTRTATVDVADVVVHGAGVDLGVVQHAVDQAEQVSLRTLDALQVRSLLGAHPAAEPHLHQLGVAADGVERGAKLVRHHGEELALGAARRFGGAACRLRLIHRP
jgi:hypothetical protein